METVIRTAKRGDVEACVGILLDSVLSRYFEEEVARAILRDGEEDGELFVADAEGRVVGFSLVAPRGAFLVFPYLHLLAVASDLRSRGVGARLLEHFERRQVEREGYRFPVKAFLLVAKANEGAVRFYERHGYALKAQFDDMFEAGDSELLMMKDLGRRAI